MYEKFFQFKESPFSLTPDPRFFYASREHEEAFEHILYGIQQRKGFILITGEVGTGKTTLCRLLLSRLDRKVKTSLIFNPSLNTIELLQAANQDFGLPGASSSRKELVDELNAFLLSELASGGNALLVIDESQNLSVECLEEIRMLSNLETEKEKLLQILMLGQPELRDKLALNELRQLNQRIIVRHHIEPFSLQETMAYVNYRIQVAGGSDRVLFTPKAFAKIQNYSQGIPRLINAVCDKSLLAAFVQEVRVINHDCVARAIKDLDGGMPRGTGAKKLPPTRHGAKKTWPIVWSLSGATAALLMAIGIAGYRAHEAPLALGEIVSSLKARFQKSEEPTTAAPQSAQVAPIPVAAPTPTATVQIEPAPPSVPKLVTDPTVRAATPEESRSAAYGTLLRLWGVETDSVAGLSPSEMDAKAMAAGFSIYEGSPHFPMLKAFGYPCIVLGRWSEDHGPTYAVLEKFSGEEAVLLDPLSGERRLSLALVETLWAGRAVIFWKSIPGISLPIPTKGRHEAVEMLQRALRSQGLFAGKPDGIWGPDTQKAVWFFQQKEGLDETGIFESTSHMVLSRLVFKKDVPTLFLGES